MKECFKYAKFKISRSLIGAAALLLPAFRQLEVRLEQIAVMPRHIKLTSAPPLHPPFCTNLLHYSIYNLLLLTVKIINFDKGNYPENREESFVTSQLLSCDTGFSL